VCPLGKRAYSNPTGARPALFRGFVFRNMPPASDPRWDYKIVEISVRLGR